MPILPRATRSPPGTTTAFLAAFAADFQAPFSGGCLLGFGRLSGFAFNPGPTFLGGLDYGFLASGAQPALFLGGFRSDRRWWLLGLGPPLTLRFGDSSPTGGAHLAPFTSCECGGNVGSFGRSTSEYLPEFGCLSVIRRFWDSKPSMAARTILSFSFGACTSVVVARFFPFRSNSTVEEQR